MKAYVMTAVLVASLGASAAQAHTYSEHGTILLPISDQADTGIFSLVEAVAPGSIPNGVFYYTVNAVQGGDTFSVIADDGQEPFVVGFASECPGPTNWAGRALARAQAGDPVGGADIVLSESWLLCNNHPDFDVTFTGGSYGNGPGDEGGTVPGSGDAVVTLFFGDVGEGFTYSES